VRYNFSMMIGVIINEAKHLFTLVHATLVQEGLAKNEEKRTETKVQNITLSREQRSLALGIFRIEISIERLVRKQRMHILKFVTVQELRFYLRT